MTTLKSLPLKNLVFLSLCLTLVGCEDSPLSGFFEKKAPSTEGQSEAQTPFKGQKEAQEAKRAEVVPWKGDAIAANTFINISKRADMGVVHIGTTKILSARSPFGNRRRGNPWEDFFGDDFFKHFFGDPFGGAPQREQKQQGLGSGFIISEDGYIVTNNHVVERADEIIVTVGKDEEYDAKVIGTDPKTDLALIKIEPKDKLTPLALGDSDVLEVGEIVVAIGNPFGLSHTVTQGIVSAKERTIGFGPYDNFIQTDASINPGNSGGPLLNLKAEVVGINSAIIASGQGIGFAIPINLAKNIFTQLRTSGSVTRGWLGVVIQEIDPEIAKALGLDNAKGVLVAGIQEGSPAEKAGMKERDVIVGVDGKDIDEVRQLQRHVANLPVGKNVKVKVIRDGKETALDLVIGKLDDEDEAGAPADGKKEDKEDSFDVMGLKVRALTDQFRQQLQIDEDVKGVVVHELDGKSPAQGKVRRGDVIREINKMPVTGLKSYREAVKKLKKGGMAMVRIQRGPRQTLFLAFPI